mmetsp:Transcript_19302/g.54713  ORF Transcript_19302/g.54713 Transcript_19302/m.54713 type:complete len:212 (+) Transcript_19302:85-720(+)
MCPLLFSAIHFVALIFSFREKGEMTGSIPLVVWMLIGGDWPIVLLVGWSNMCFIRARHAQTKHEWHTNATLSHLLLHTPNRLVVGQVRCGSVFSIDAFGVVALVADSGTLPFVVGCRVAIQHEGGPALGVLQSAFVTVTQRANLPTEDLVDGVHGWTDQRIRFPRALHEDAERCGPTGIELRAFVAVDDHLGVILAVHAIIWQVQGADLPQ